MSVQSQIDRLNSIKQRIRTNLVAQGVTVPEDTMLDEMAELILSVAGENGNDYVLTEADKQLDSPYNTYLYQGLVRGPIANPGLNSLNAALVPEDTDYYYYALDPDINKHHFSSTQSEHDNFLASLEDND